MISIIILNYNDKLLTEKYVKRISKFGKIDHIIIVDNSSPDKSYKYLKKLENNKIKVIKTKSNKGYASGNNFGINYVYNHYGNEGIIIISNPDIEIEEQAFNEIIGAFDKYKDLFAATGEVLNLKKERIPLFTWKVPTKSMIFLENSVVLRVLFRKLFKYSRRYNKISDIEKKEYYCGEALPGCFFAVDMNKFKKLNFFCEETFLYFEEDILFSKAKKEEYKSIVVKNANLIHAEGVTTKKNISSWKAKEDICERSAIVYLKKCLNANSLDIFLYKLMNRLFLIERYLFYIIKNKIT